MKTIVTTMLLSLCSLLAEAELKEVGYRLGPQLFREGDCIQIEAVKASSSRLGIGDTVVVTGHYTLESHEAGKISIFVTQTEGDGHSDISPEQQFEVKERSGAFEVSIQMQHKGYLHVSFYPTDGGRGFGGVYLGKPKQMEAIKDWTLDWYLKAPVSGKALNEASHGTLYLNQ